MTVSFHPMRPLAYKRASIISRKKERNDSRALSLHTNLFTIVAAQRAKKLWKKSNNLPPSQGSIA